MYIVLFIYRTVQQIRIAKSNKVLRFIIIKLSNMAKKGRMFAHHETYLCVSWLMPE